MSTTTLPRQNPPEVQERGRAARVVDWIVYLAFGFFARLWLLGFWAWSRTALR
jgi:hypothetical protein